MSNFVLYKPCCESDFTLHRDECKALKNGKRDSVAQWGVAISFLVRSIRDDIEKNKSDL